MAIFILLAFGILLLIGVLIFRKRNVQGYDTLMHQNKGVQPLLKERSANVKHDQLLEQFKDNPAALRKLIDLQNQYAEKQISAASYETSLDSLALEYKG